MSCIKELQQPRRSHIPIAVSQRNPATGGVAIDQLAFLAENWGRKCAVGSLISTKSVAQFFFLLGK